MYAIEKNGKKNYLFGTLHCHDIDLSAEAMRAFKQADCFLAESIELNETNIYLTELVKQWLQKHPEYTMLSTMDDSPLWQGFVKFNKIATAHNLPLLEENELDNIRYYPPYVAWMIFYFKFQNLFAGDPDQCLDSQLINICKITGKPVYALEEMKTKIEKIFQLDLSAEDSFDLFEHFFNAFNHDSFTKESFEDNFFRIKNAYLEDDFEKVKNAALEIFSESTPPLDKLFDKLRKNLANDREASMIIKMKKHLDNGNAFIAIGAVHLPGIIKTLNSDGYIITPIKQGQRNISVGSLLINTTQSNFPFWTNAKENEVENSKELSTNNVMKCG